MIWRHCNSFMQHWRPPEDTRHRAEDCWFLKFHYSRKFVNIFEWRRRSTWRTDCAERQHSSMPHQIEAWLWRPSWLLHIGLPPCFAEMCAMFRDLFWRCGRFTRASWYPAKFVGNSNASTCSLLTWPRPTTGCTKGRSLYCYSIAKFSIIFTDDKTPPEIDSWRPKDYPNLP